MLIEATKNIMIGRQCAVKPTEIPAAWNLVLKGVNEHQSVAKIVIKDSICCADENWFQLECLVCSETHIELGGGRNSDGLGLLRWKEHESTVKHQNSLHGPAPGTEAGQRMRVIGLSIICRGYFRKTVQFSGISGEQLVCSKQQDTIRL
jgi:hypothetical protein